MGTRKTFPWIEVGLVAFVLLIFAVVHYSIMGKKEAAENKEQKSKQDSDIKQFVEKRKIEAEKRRNLTLMSGDKVVSIKVSGGFGWPVQEAPNAIYVQGGFIESKYNQTYGGIETSIYLKNDGKEAVSTEVMLYDNQSGLQMTGKVKLGAGEGKPINLSLLGQSQRLYILIPPGNNKEDDN